MRHGERLHAVERVGVQGGIGVLDGGGGIAMCSAPWLFAKQLKYSNATQKSDV